MKKQKSNFILPAKKATKKADGQTYTRWVFDTIRELDGSVACAGYGWRRGNLNLREYARAYFGKWHPQRLEDHARRENLSAAWNPYGDKKITHAKVLRALGLRADDLKTIARKKRIRREVKEQLAEAQLLPGGGVPVLTRLADRVDLEVRNVLPWCRESMGGVTRLIIRSGSRTYMAAMRDTCRDYAKSCKWHENHGDFNIYISVREAGHIHNIGGVITICQATKRSIMSGRKAYKCKWLKPEVARGYRTKLVATWCEGWICGGFHADTKAEAAWGYRRHAEAERRARMTPAEAHAELCRNVRSEAERILAAAGSREVTVFRADSYSAGNCQAGTAAWGDRYAIGESCPLRSLLAGALLDARAGRDTWRHALLAGWQAVRRSTKKITNH